MLDVGFKNYIKTDTIKNVLKPGSSKTKWLIKEALAGRKIINCTQGKKVGSIIILDTDHVVLSPLKYLSVIKRLKIHPVIIEKINEAVLNQEFTESLKSE